LKPSVYIINNCLETLSPKYEAANISGIKFNYLEITRQKDKTHPILELGIHFLINLGNMATNDLQKISALSGVIVEGEDKK